MVAAEAPAQGAVADEAETDRGERELGHAAGAAVHDLRHHHEQEAREEGEDQRADGDQDERGGEQQPLRAHVVHQGAARCLARDGDEGAHRERQPDASLRPALRREVEGDERAETRLHVGDEEVQPVESALASGRGMRLLARAGVAVLARAAVVGSRVGHRLPFLMPEAARYQESPSVARAAASRREWLMARGGVPPTLTWPPLAFVPQCDL